MPADLATLSALKARVEAATGPDRELDREIHAGFGLPGHVVVHRDPLWNLYTSSVDAALSLLKRMLPEFGYRLQTQLGGRLPVCTLHAPPGAPDASITDSRSWSRQHEGGGASPPLAILSALLTAKIAQLEVDHAR